MNIDWLFPLLAIIIYFATPKGCYKQINAVLLCLLVFIFGYEEHIIANGIYDSGWHDIFMISVYGLAAALFYAFCGTKQLILALIGITLHAGYGLGWLYGVYPSDFYYREVFVTLTILQLLAASKGALWSILYKKLGGSHGHRVDSHGVGRDPFHRHRM